MTPSIARLRQALEAYDTAASGRDEARALGALMTEVPEAIREVLDLLDAAEKDAGRLDWLLSNPNTVLEDAGNEWFILDEDGEPTYFKTGRTAIDAEISARASTAGDAL